VKLRRAMATHLENLPSPLFAKEGNYPSLWQREVRRDFKKLLELLLSLSI
jgi:hypothetical protein